MEESVGFEVGRDQRRALVSVFRGDVVTDGPALVENESVVVLTSSINNG